MVDLDLSRRAVACRGWRWMPGMRYVSDAWNRDGFDRVPEHLDLVAFQAWVAALPDLADPATRGALLQLVREAWNEPQAFAMCALGMWFVRGPVKPLWLPSVGKDSEIEILVAALEAAPERTK